jgi:glycine betaine transporter
MAEKSVYKKPAFIVALVICLLFLAAGTIFSVPFKTVSDQVFAFMTNNLGWSFIWGASLFVFISLFLMFSPIGKIRLGKDDERPEYSNFTWFAMLFSCGMGIGLLFWGVSEPIWHYMWPPFGEAYSAEAGHVAIRYALFHWGLHPWAIYAVVGVALAYFSYRKGLPMMLSSTLEPLIGKENLDRGWGSVVNIIAVFATLFGLATSLGLGAMQIGAGLDSLFGIPDGAGLWLVIVVVVTAAAVTSTVTGINKGIKFLSQLNMYIALLLMILVFIFGPTLFILNMMGHATGDYLQNIISMSFRLDPMQAGEPGWITAEWGWTVFYWAWWIAWAPFVGTFIARISKGRTIREFVTGVLLIPTAFSIIWFSIFGGSAIHIEHFGAGGIADAVSVSNANGFFAMLQHFPASQLLIFVAMASVAIFFITSSDSASYVNGMLTSSGNPNPPVGLRYTWGILEGAIAALLLFVGGDTALTSLQTASVVGGFPFMIIMFLMIYCIFKSLYAERSPLDIPFKSQEKDIPA